MPTAKPLEAFPAHDNRRRTKHIGANDLDDAAVRQSLLNEIAAGFYFWIHIALPCTGWATMNARNGGSRSNDNPEGDELLERERLANHQATYVVEICLALAEVGAFFSIENPVPSHVWICACFRKLMCELDGAMYIVNFDQCAYSLVLPGAAKHHYCRKSSRVWTNMVELCRLERRCPGRSAMHFHDEAFGHVVVQGVRHSRAAAASRYPLELCREFAEGGERALQRSLRTSSV